MAACRKAYFPSLTIAAIALATALSPACAASASATTVDELQLNYQLATAAYEQTLAEQAENARQLETVEDEMHAAELEFAQSKERLGESVAALYKHERNRAGLVDALLGSESLADAIALGDSYARIERYWSETMESIRRERARLTEKHDQLKERRDDLSDRVFETENAVSAAEAALRDADHSDGAAYHQRQGNGSNCGATSFIVGVNILLHENRYPDNVEVWKGAGFEGDSTQSLAFKGATWLMANGLSDQISCEEVPGDIRAAAQLASELEQGKVVVISSGSGSVWQRADGSQAGPGVFPDGHWIVFYHYADGIFYANDSSVRAPKGAGCAYTSDQMQQWLNGRSTHFATTLSKKSFGAK